MNLAETHSEAFLDTVIPAAPEKGMGVIAMKNLCRGPVSRLPGERRHLEPLLSPFTEYLLDDRS